ncbi:MAG: hypothetical protein WDM91_11520 [Rhizomicrobium sp.]
MRSFTIAFVALSMLAVTAARAQDDSAPAIPPPAAPEAPDPLFALDDAGFDAQFQCPDPQSSPDARLEELARYTEWAKLHHPDWNFKKRLDVRYSLLRRHACAATLANIAASARPPFGS